MCPDPGASQLCPVSGGQECQGDCRPVLPLPGRQPTGPLPSSRPRVSPAVSALTPRPPEPALFLGGGLRIQKDPCEEADLLASAPLASVAWVFVFVPLFHQRK